MPLFDFECRSCGEFFEDHLSPSHPTVCPDCGEPVSKQVQEPAGVIGIVSSNAKVNHQMGMVFTSNKQEREFFKRNPNIRELIKGSPDEIKFRDKVRGRAERSAKKQGYRDHEDKVTTLKKRRDAGELPPKKGRKPLTANGQQK